MDMQFVVLPDQTIGPAAAATLLVAAAALMGAVAPMVLRRLATLVFQRALRSANDNEEGFASPRTRLRCV